MFAQVSTPTDQNNLITFQASPIDTKLKKDFEAWWTAAKTNNTSQLARYEQQFKHHTLYPMGRYLYLLENLNTAHHQDILAFITTYSELGLSNRLQHRYLNALANQQAWSNITTSHLTPANQQQQCLSKRALLVEQPNQLPLNDWQNFWLNNLNLHRSCREVEQFLHKQGLLNTDALLKRITALFNQQRHGQIRNIIAMLPPNEKLWNQAWLNLVQNPNEVASFDFNNIPEPYRAKVTFTSLHALSRHDPEHLLKLLEDTRFKAWLSADQHIQLQREAGLRLSYRFNELGWRTLDRLNNQRAEEATLIWQARYAIRHSKWTELASIISRMPEATAEQPQWRYWNARALEASGQAGHQQLYEQLAKDRNYYGFLAADRLDQPYIMPLSDARNELSQARANELIKTYPSLKLITALIEIDWRINAHREWHHLLNHAQQEDFFDLAKIAHEWGLHHLAITTLGRVQAWDAVNKRFPTPFQKHVTAQAAQHEIDQSFIFSIMRRESAFYPQARSPAGAQGLMQLMPNTARETARKQGLTSFRAQDIFKPEINIQLGSAYFAEMMTQFDHPVLAIAAYNAGPGRVSHWRTSLHLANIEKINADQWIDTLPFTETRRYVRQVLEHKLVYDFMLKIDEHHDPKQSSHITWNPPHRLTNYMAPIKAN
ncbi:lytic transglycosylase domain-containing protein [Thiomicrospira sp. ALE5]|uniref:lytic transglycosylase domain-containing protein n=1 Tax=Thiomicrospira sp. ALE5 TaxID=748650 RepID=UPI001F3CEB8E|nr:lytic transglycosylase domain-containing protein [Thiomicrospira sp. ALE5]